jgi:hypothetical protein
LVIFPRLVWVHGKLDQAPAFTSTTSRRQLRCTSERTQICVQILRWFNEFRGTFAIPTQSAQQRPAVRSLDNVPFLF